MVDLLPQLGYTVLSLALSQVANFLIIVEIMPRLNPKATNDDVGMVLAALVGIAIKYKVLMWGGVWGGGKSAAALFFLFISVLQVLACGLIVVRILNDPSRHTNVATASGGKEYSFKNVLLGPALASLLSSTQQ